MRLLKTPAFWLLSIALTIVVLANWNNESSGRGRASAGEGDGSKATAGSKTSEPSRPDNLIREGTELNNLRVQVRKAPNGRITVFDEQTKRTLVCLENLWLQRILVAQKNEDPSAVWIVSGKVTEFEGINYLQIAQASKSN
ncbi:MAG: hypothetical protein MUC43_06665 [Pirellula sp.]|nr:hypothetical protein [Pirellula sp.]